MSLVLPKQSSSLYLLLLLLLLLHYLHLWNHRSLKNLHFHHLLLPRHLSPTLRPQASSQFTTERYAHFSYTVAKKAYFNQRNLCVYASVVT